jgi:hypothetical protein
MRRQFIPVCRDLIIYEYIIKMISIDATKKKTKRSKPLRYTFGKVA